MIKTRCVVLLVVSMWTSLLSAENSFGRLDGHVHYSHDAWDVLQPAKAIAILRQAGVTRAFVSSSSDDGTQMLYQQAPDLIVPVLRPYHQRGELSSWMHDEERVEYLRERIRQFEYAGIGEFHASHEDIDSDTIQSVIQLAKQHNMFLHAHVNAEAIHKIFQSNPQARVLWAHAGFESADVVRETLDAYASLWADLSFRESLYDGYEIDPEWRSLFMQFPNRFVLGSDTYTPVRWFYVSEYFTTATEWLSLLPDDIAENIAWKNGEKLLQGVWPR